MAKTTRDRQIRGWVFPEEARSSAYEPNESNMKVLFREDRGSGYPSDPNTKKWMERNYDELFGYPTFVRFSWGAAKTLMDKHAVAVDW